MADQKVTDLTALTTFSGDETFYVVEDDDGSPVSRKVTIEDLIAGLRSLTLDGAYAPLHIGDCYESILTSPTTMVNANTFYDGPSLSLGAGDWLVQVEADCSSANASATFHTIRIYDGTTVYASRGGYHGGGAGGSSHLSARARITLGSTTTIKLQCASIRGTSDSVILDTATANGTADKCTRIIATKVTAV